MLNTQTATNRYLVIPTFIFVISILLIFDFSIDFWVSDLLYYLEGGQWALRDTWITENFLHTGGRTLSVLLALGLLVLFLLSFLHECLKPYRRGLLYVFLAALLGSLIVSTLKSLTHRDCPWDLLRYGGLKPELSYFSTMLETGLEKGKCFPAGHASAGYCWFGFYFFARRFFPEWRMTAFLLPLATGMVFGFDQQLRGAHFISHDLWSAWICWVSAFALSFMIKVPNPQS